MKNENLAFWKNKFESYLKTNPLEDKSHDISHFQRVWRLANQISEDSDDKLVILAACYFHDIVNYPKNHSKRSFSSIESAKKAKTILVAMGFPKDKIPHVEHCIEAHSFSADIQTKTREAEIVQDSDRMESLGAIGLARTFYVAGQMESHLFSDQDPFGEVRELDDSKYAIDHFKLKLLKLPNTMKTQKGREVALKRADVLKNFLIELKGEL